jgi:uncharacterized phage infection (PIP) family protein YhgE
LPALLSHFHKIREKTLNALTHGILALPHHAQFLIAVVVLMTFAFHARFNDVAHIHGPTILTTFGIFSTFLGIAIGLADFDPKNIQSSMPSLLDGIRTAFWASVVGVGGALTIKFRHYFVLSGVPADGSKSEDDVTVADIERRLVNIQRALVGKDEGAISSHLKLLNSEICARLDALSDAQKESLEKMSAMGSKSLVEGLRDVIREFNSKISDQFGDNFKQLNSAVYKLVDWQGNYKNHIEHATAQLKSTEKSMAEAANSFKELVRDSQSFVGVSDGFLRILNAIEIQRDQLHKMLDSLRSLIDSVSSNLPTVRNQVLQLTKDVTQSVQKNQSQLNEALNQNAASIKTSLDDSARQMNQANETFNKNVTEMVNKTNQQIAALDAALETELTKSLTSLGKQLTALSERFVKDYMPLTERLREVVRIYEEKKT